MDQSTLSGQSKEIKNILTSYVKTLPESLKTQFPNASIINFDSLLNEGLTNVKSYLAKAKTMNDTQIDEFIANFNNTIMHPDVTAYIEKNNLELFFTQITEYVKLLQKDTLAKKEFISQFTTEYDRIKDLTIDDLREVLLTKGGASKYGGKFGLAINSGIIGSGLIVIGALITVGVIVPPVGILLAAVAIGFGSILLLCSIYKLTVELSNVYNDPGRGLNLVELGRIPRGGGKSKSRRNKKSKRKYKLKRKKTNRKY